VSFINFDKTMVDHCPRTSFCWEALFFHCSQL